MRFRIEVLRVTTQPITERCIFTIEAENEEGAKEIALDCAEKDSGEDWDEVEKMSEWEDEIGHDTEEDYEIDKCEELTKGF